VVGTCAAGYDPTDNKVGDIIYTNTMIQDKTNENFGQHQYFWEAFPVSIGRNGVTETNVKTTYMFTYMDAEMERPSLETLMEDYWNLLPTSPIDIRAHSSFTKTSLSLSIQVGSAEKKESRRDAHEDSKSLSHLPQEALKLSSLKAR
jgi:hypothetical protein